MIVYIQTSTSSPDPELVLEIQNQEPDIIVVQTTGIPGITGKAPKSACLAIQSIQSRCCSDPEISFRILQDIADIIIAQAVGVVGIMSEM